MVFLVLVIQAEKNEFVFCNVTILFSPEIVRTPGIVKSVLVRVTVFKPSTPKTHGNFGMTLPCPSVTWIAHLDAWGQPREEPEPFHSFRVAVGGEGEK